MNEIRNANGLTEKEFLEQYKPSDYERPSVTVDMLVLGMNKELDSLKVLLIKRKDHPYIGCWALAGGFVNIDESAYQAACRELEEETGLQNIYLEQIYTMSQPDRDPRMRVIDIAYMALIPVVEAHAGDDAEDAIWFDVTFSDTELSFWNKEKDIKIRYSLEKKEFSNGSIKLIGYNPVLNNETFIEDQVQGIPVLRTEKLAFDHAEIILEGLLRLRNKIEYSDIAFNLVPEEFTLPDLKRVYEIILGRELYKTNFKGKMVGKIEPLNKRGKSIVGNKSTDLYKYRG